MGEPNNLAPYRGPRVLQGKKLPFCENFEEIGKAELIGKKNFFSAPLGIFFTDVSWYCV